MKSHNDLRVYREAMDLVTDAHKITDNFPDSEKFGLGGQICYSAVSIPSNIVAGAVGNP